MNTNNPRRCVKCGEIRYVPVDALYMCPICGHEQFTFKMAPVPSNIKYTEEAKEERFWQCVMDNIPDLAREITEAIKAKNR
jgi:predicted  nucleic acid-binding Zn-ribbon protein